MINGSSGGFNAFPHIPGKALDRKEGIKRIMQRLQEIHHDLRYQVRTGESDLQIKVKLQFKNDYRPYVAIPLSYIDPNESVPDWDLVNSRKKPNPVNPFSWQTKAGKRGASSSPEDARIKKKNNQEEIDDWQIAKFLYALLEGMAMTPKYVNLDWTAEARLELTEVNPAATEDTPNETENSPVDTPEPSSVNLIHRISRRIYGFFGTK